MKFSILLALALSYTTLTSAQNFRKDNADKAEQLTKEFAKLTRDSPCENNAQACVEDQFAQCVNGKFQLNSCGGGELKCVVLPLVNKAGTSITCSTEADRLARLADARGEKPPSNQVPDQGKVPDQVKVPDQEKGKDGKGKDGKGKDGKGKDGKGKDGKGKDGKGKDGDVPPGEGKDGKAPGDGKDGKAPGEGKDGKAPGDGKDEKAPGDGKDGKAPGDGKDGKAPGDGKDGKAPGDGKDGDVPPGEGKDGKAPGEGKDGKVPQDNLKSPPANGDGNLAEIRKQNAADAEALQEKFSKLKPDDKCNDNDVACVDNKFAQCSGGKFALTDCASGTVCAALPLVLKRGTTVACTTEADRDARLEEAKNSTKK
jgi:hypothetical protein